MVLLSYIKGCSGIVYYFSDFHYFAVHYIVWFNCNFLIFQGLPQYAWGGPSDEEGLKRAYEDNFEIQLSTNNTAPVPLPGF